MARKIYSILTMALICLLSLNMIALSNAFDVNPSDVTLGVQAGDSQTYEFTFSYANFEVYQVYLDIDGDNETDVEFLVKSGDKVNVTVTSITSQGLEYLWKYKMDNGTEFTSDTLSREWEDLAEAYPVLLEYQDTGTASWFITINQTLIETYGAEGIFDSVEFTETTIRIKASRLLPAGIVVTLENVYDLNTGWLINATIAFALQDSPTDIYGEVKLAKYTPPTTTDPTTSSAGATTESSAPSSTTSSISTGTISASTSGFSFFVLISIGIFIGITRRKKEV